MQEQLYPWEDGATFECNDEELNRLYRAGVRTVVPAQRPVPAHLIDPKVKNRSRIYYQVANIQAQRIDASAWALLTDGEGVITEVLKDASLKSDPIHPNARGYRLIAERLAATLKKTGAL